MAYTTINKPNLHFNTVTWTGDSTTPKTITGVGFQPDLIWGKDRSSAYSHQLFDAVRGFGSEKELTANANLAEGGQNADTYGYLSGVTSDGFTTVKGSDAAGYDYWNESPDNYVAWNWKASNTTAVSNTAGTISSTVSANTTSGFSIFTYTGTGAGTATVGHGCSSEPKFVFIKNRTNASGWVTYHYGAGATGLYNPNQASLILNGTNASANPASGGYLSDGYFSNVNSTTITLRDVNNANNVNATSNNYVGYAFAEVKGYSKFGSYTGNGSTDGTFVYTGFKPAFIMIKNTTVGDGWQLIDAKRNVTNGYNNSRLEANNANTESVNSTWTLVDLLSNGFKQRYTDNIMNASGSTYIYMAFAEQPLVGTNNVPATAR